MAQLLPLQDQGPAFGVDWSRMLDGELDFIGPVSRQPLFWALPEIKATILSCSGHRKRLTLVLPRLEKCPMSPVASAAIKCLSSRNQVLPSSWNSTIIILIINDSIN